MSFSKDTKNIMHPGSAHAQTPSTLLSTHAPPVPQQPTAQTSAAAYQRMHHTRSIQPGHRRAKSAGQASSIYNRDYVPSSHYAATGLYAHQSGEQLDSATVASAAASQLWTIAPIVKRTASEHTLRHPTLDPHYHGPPPYYSESYHHLPLSSRSRRHSSVKYSSLKSGGAQIGGPSSAGAGGTTVGVYGTCDNDDVMMISEDEECACWSVRLRSLQHFAKIQFFVFLCCILVTLQQALSSGYFNSVITTIEKRFDISSQMSGMIVSTFELGNLATIIFVSYFGSHRHIPRWIGTGIVVTGIGSLIFAMPHFMSLSDGDSNGNSSRGHLSDDNTCRIPQAHLSSPFLEKASSFINPPLGATAYDDPTCSDSAQHTIAPQMGVFMLAMVLIGCGGTPIFTLGTTYIDDHVPKESSSMYMGCMYSMVAFGLVCGFLLGGFFINVHENAYGTGVTPMDIFPGHPKWIGAWWAGFILLGVLLLVISIPFFIFPKSLKPKRSSNKEAVLLVTSTAVSGTVGPSTVTQGSPKVLVIAQEDGIHPNASKYDSLHHSNPPTKPYGRSIGEIPACMYRLLCNPIYMVTCLGSCMELAIVSGFLIFLPKYLETQFSLGKSEANLFAGGIAIPGACVGIFLGGYLLKRLQLSPKGAIQVVLFFNLICMGLYTALYFLGCENVRMAGTTLPYANTSHFDTFRVNLTADCNLGCRCSSNDLEPVCDLRNKISYYSPCFAGCTSVDYSGHRQNYSNCACLPQSSSQNSLTPLGPPINSMDSVTMVPLVVPGPCPQLCNAMLPFMVLLFVITLVVSITQMPVVMITLRSVAEEERSLALGMQFVLFRLFGYIPSPIVFGQVIDSTCLVWKAHCGLQGGFCLLYNIEQFRLRYVGVCSALKVTAALLFFLDWLLICWQEKRELKSAKMHTSAFSPEELVSSIISLDRLSVFGASGPNWNETITETDEEQQPLSDGGEGGSGGGPSGAVMHDSDYNSAIEEEDEDEEEEEEDETTESTSVPTHIPESSSSAQLVANQFPLNSSPKPSTSQDGYPLEVLTNSSTRHRRHHSQSHFV